MITPGLVSVTFRKLTPAAIIALVKQAGLSGIEWGGDIHVPHGDVARSREVRQQTLEAGLMTLSYGSYYRCAGDKLAFELVLESALALGTPTIRVWAGGLGSAQANPEQRAAVIADSRRIGDLAAKAGIKIAYEYHGGTFTDTDESAQQLLREVNHPNVGTLWQPRVGPSIETNSTSLRAILPQLVNLHVYHWSGYPADRRPLSEGADAWRNYFAILAGTGRDYAVLLEFVQNDEPQNFLRDAATLTALLSELR